MRYCKFCGNRMEQNSNKCPVCGAVINLNDGGQTFYDDNELDAWAVEAGAAGMPKTEILVPGGKKVKKEKVVAVSSLKQNGAQRPSSSRTAQSRNRNGKRKSSKVSASNKIIILCIAIVLVLVVAILALVKSNTGTTEGIENKGGIWNVKELHATPTPEPTPEPTPVPESNREGENNGVVKATAKPKNNNVSKHKVNESSKANEAPKATPKASEAPKATPKASEAPKATPKASEAPKATPKVSEAPKATPKASEAPKATPKASEAPKKVVQEGEENN